MLERMKTGWRWLQSLGRMQREEYRATMNALNIFFGAIIGVNFASAEGLPLEDYVTLLLLTALTVTNILIVSNTRRRLWSTLNLGLFLIIFYLAFYAGEIFDEFGDVPEKLLPTLVVWAGLAVMFEFSPREEDSRP